MCFVGLRDFSESPLLVTLSPYQHRPYRPCVGIMLINQTGQVFVGQRLDNQAEAWQMPQGGIDAGETELAAAMRELGEETGVEAAAAEVLRVHAEWLNYDLPLALADQLWDGKYRGQTQKWFAMRFLGGDGDINIHTAHAEFSAWQWVGAGELPGHAVGFKRDIYRRLVADFGDLLG